MTRCSQREIHNKFYSCSRNRRQLICMFPYFSIEIHVPPSGSVHPRSIVTTWKWGAHRHLPWIKTARYCLCLPLLELHCSVPFALSHWLSWSSLVLPNESQQPSMPGRTPCPIHSFFPLLPEKFWPESSWFGKGKGWAHFTGKDSSVNSLQFIISAATATFPLAGLWCAILVGMNGKWVAVAVRHECQYICACGHCKLVLCVQDIGFTWINIPCSLFPSKD